MSEPSTLQFENLAGGYGAMVVVKTISGAVHRGQCLCILGRNGVGKSTAVKLLAGHLPTSAGSVMLNGEPINGLAPHDRHSRGMSYAPQERPIFDNLTIEDNLLLMRPDRSLESYAAYFETFPVLGNRLSQVAGTLSGGERKILSFVRTMAEMGLVTILDEPTEGVQPENIEYMQRQILDAKSTGRSFVIVEQHVHMAQVVADDYLIMDHGECVLAGDASEISRKEILKRIEV